MKTKTKEVEKFIETYSSEEHPEIVRMLDRQKDWENTLVVMDWTGSMYGFGGEVMKWHLLNFEKSGIQKKFPEINLGKNNVGIFGKQTTLEHSLKNKDRIEIYRPLIIDPKELRRKKAAEGKKKGGGK